MVARSPEPKAHVSNVRAFRVELEFRSDGFLAEGKTGVPGEKPLGAEKRTNNKLDPHDSTESGNQTPSHIDGRRVLSPLHHPCSLHHRSEPFFFSFNSVSCIHSYVLARCVVSGCERYATDSPSSQIVLFIGDEPARCPCPSGYEVLLHGDFRWKSHWESWHGHSPIPGEQIAFDESPWTWKGAN